MTARPYITKSLTPNCESYRQGRHQLRVLQLRDATRRGLREQDGGSDLRALTVAGAVYAEVHEFLVSSSRVFVYLIHTCRLRSSGMRRA